MNISYSKTKPTSTVLSSTRSADTKIASFAALKVHTMQIPAPHGEISLANPLCGDHISISYELSRDNHITAIGHNTQGCTVCQASANILAEAAIGANLGQIKEARATMAVLLEQDELTLWSSTQWQKFEIFSSLKDQKKRHGCVLLPFNALIGAMQSAN